MLWMYVRVCLGFFKRFSLSLERGKGRKKEGEKPRCARDTLISCLSHAPTGGLGLQPSHLPWLGIEPVTSGFAGWHPVLWATPAREDTLLNEQLEEILLKCSECAPWICVHFLSFNHQKDICFQRRKMDLDTQSVSSFLWQWNLLTNNYLTSTLFSGAAEDSYQIWPVIK